MRGTRSGPWEFSSATPPESSCSSSSSSSSSSSTRLHPQQRALGLVANQRHRGWIICHGARFVVIEFGDLMGHRFWKACCHVFKKRCRVSALRDYGESSSLCVCVCVCVCACGSRPTNPPPTAGCASMCWSPRHKQVHTHKIKFHWVQTRTQISQTSTTWLGFHHIGWGSVGPAQELRHEPSACGQLRVATARHSRGGLRHGAVGPHLMPPDGTCSTLHGTAGQTSR